MENRSNDNFLGYNDGWDRIKLIRSLFKAYGEQLRNYRHEGNDVIFYLNPQTDIIDFMAMVNTEIDVLVSFKSQLQLYFEQAGLRMCLRLN